EEDFARQLDALVESHDVVPLDQLFDTAEISSRPRAAITFDDAYKGALTTGVDELVKRGMPATIFVAPALLGCTTWWDKLAEPKSGVVPSEVRLRALDMLGGRSDAILGWASSKSAGLQSESTLPRIGSESELIGAASKPGITLGSHSWSHPNLSSLSPIELETELARPLQWLGARHVTALPWLSYPYGLFDSTVERAAKKAGYRGAFRTDGGWIPRSLSSPSFAIPRLSIPSGLSIDGFRLRLAGIGAGR
ncbi:MAG: polysaccharide deacetylase family protein, partial [Candidatus Dormibacteraeota bacterium]|nr:polysaccharide deacetylase family protein [Candidatus Dormibacteraeota bacterium]